ncbi:MAG: prepilin peptidase [archaeon]
MIELNFLFWFFLAGIIVAVFQDLKRREVDNWLTLFLLIGGLVYILFLGVIGNDYSIIVRAGFLLLILIVLHNLFYYGHVFAGGDAKLLLALTALFVGANYYESIINLGLFILFLMLAGSVYGIVYSLVLYIRYYGNVNREIRNEFRKWKFKYYLLTGVLLGALGFLNFYFFILAFFIISLPPVFAFARGLEKVSMIKNISGKQLREGDWLAHDVRVGKKIVKANWDGLSKKDIELMKNLKKVTIKEGIPFVPAFLIGFIFYSFFRGWFLKVLFGFG